MAEREELMPRYDPSLVLAPQTLKNCFLAWLVPGLGYWLLDRKKSAVLISVCLYTAYFFAFLLGGDLYELTTEGKIRMLGTVCQSGMGIPYFLAKLGLDRGSPLNASYDYGTTYFLIAGMIN